MKFRKIIVPLIVAMVLVLSACTPETIEVTKEVEVEKEVIVTKEVEVDTSPLSITIPWTGDAMDLFMPVVEGFEAETGIDVKVLPYDTADLGPLLPAQFAAEEPMADVFIMSWSWWIEQNSEHLVDISDVAGDYDFLANTVEVDGAVYGIPSYLFVKPGFWYRQSFFEANNLVPAETWDDFLVMLDEINGISHC
jgi:multiple sugar transport system substrate-binding protein